MTGNLNTLADARLMVRQWVGSSACDTTVIDARIAEAEQRLWRKGDLLRLSKRRMRIRVQNQCFTLPIEVEKIIAATVDGTPALMFNQAYEYLNSGLGDLDFRDAMSFPKNIVYTGEFPTQFDIPIILSSDTATTTNCCDATYTHGYQLAAFASSIADSQKFLTVRGLDRMNDEIRTAIDGALSPGEKFQVNRWHGGIEGEINGAWTELHLTTSLFRQADRVYKEVTDGPVSLYAIDTAENEMFLLSKMTPEITIPSYQRYRITNQACSGDCAVITALVKVRYRKATRADDVLSVQNLSALKAMVMAISYENQGKIQEAAQYEASAIRLLMEEKTDIEGGVTGTPIIVDVLYATSLGAMQVNGIYGR